MRKTWLAAFAAAAAACAMPALAATETFEFKGACANCYGGNGNGTGQLVLKDYSYGQDISPSNFVSFHYDGTNLMPAFTITSDPQYGIFGSMQSAGPAAQDFYAQNADNYVETFSSGFWGVGQIDTGYIIDFGSSHTFTGQSPAVSAAPEPAAWALMIMGVGMAGIALRRRHRTTVSYA